MSSNPGVATWNGAGGSGRSQRLYTTADEAGNPALGLTGGNTVTLPQQYPTLSVLNSLGIQGQIVTATNSTLYLNGVPIGGGAGGDVSRWAEYPAIHDVIGEKSIGIFAEPLRDIKDFKNVHAGIVHADIVAGVPGSGALMGGLLVSAPFHEGTDAVFGDSDEHNGSLEVYGGVTLDGGVVHGTSIGCLPVPPDGGVNTQRIDVLPVGIDIVAATYVTIDAAGAANIAAGGALSLAGGDYIETNTDDIICRNSTAGNDVTRMSIGKIVRANNGKEPLRLTDDEGGDYARGVVLDHGRNVESQVFRTKQTETAIEWTETIMCLPQYKYRRYGKIYRPFMSHRGVDPASSTLPGWNSAKQYDYKEIVKSENGVYQARDDPAVGILPGANPFGWESISSTVSKVTDVWFYAEPTDNGSLTFEPLAGEATYWSIAKPREQPFVSVVKRLNSDKSVVGIGHVYDTVFNPPTTSDISVTSDLDMNGFRLFNASKVEGLQMVIPEKPLRPGWSTTTLYDPQQIVSFGANVYQALQVNRLVDPTATSLPLYSPGYYYEGQIVRVLVSAVYQTYRARADIPTPVPPPSSPLSWEYLPTVNAVGDVWASVPPDRYSLTFSPENPAVETSYITLQKDRLDGTLSITRRAVSTGLPLAQGLLYDDTINVPDLANLACTGNVFLNQHSLLDVDSLDANYIRLGVPDSPYYQLIRWWNEDLCWQSPSSAYIPVSSSWWKTGQGGPLAFELDIKEGLRIRDPDGVGQHWTVNASSNNKLVVNQRAFLSTPNSTSLTLENINNILFANATSLATTTGGLSLGGSSLLNAGTVGCSQLAITDVVTSLGTYDLKFNNGALSYKASSSSTWLPVASSASTWSTFAATQNVNMASYALTNLSRLQMQDMTSGNYEMRFVGGVLSYRAVGSSTWLPVATPADVSTWSQYAATETVDLDSNNITNIGTITQQDLVSGVYDLRFNNGVLSFKPFTASTWTPVGSASTWSLYPATENVDWGQNSILNCDSGFFNDLRLGIPDTSSYKLYRHYNGEFAYQDEGSGSFLPVAGRWSVFAPLAPVTWNLETNGNITYRNVDNPTEEPAYQLNAGPDIYSPGAAGRSSLLVNAQPFLYKGPADDGFEFLWANKVQFRDATSGGTAHLRAEGDIFYADIVASDGTPVTTKQVAYTSDIVASSVQSGRAYIDVDGYAEITLPSEYADTLYNVTATYFGTGSLRTSLSVANLTTTGFRVYGSIGENITWMSVR